MTEERLPVPAGDPEDGGNAEIGCGLAAGSEGDEFAEPLKPKEVDPEGEFADDEELLRAPLPDEIPEADDEA